MVVEWIRFGISKRGYWYFRNRLHRGRVCHYAYFVCRSDTWRCPARGVAEQIEKTLKNGFARFFQTIQNAEREPPREQETRGSPQLVSYFWRLSLSVLSGLEKAIYARDTHRPAGSEARGEGRERGNLLDTTPKPPVAQRAGGIYQNDQKSRMFFCLHHVKKVAKSYKHQFVHE